MKKKAIKINLMILLAAAVLFFLPASNYAQEHGHGEGHGHDKDEHHGYYDNDEHHDHHDRGHGRKERGFVRHDDDYREVVVRDRHVFYRGGAFYERRPEGYVVVTAPIGARIDVLPGGCKVVRHHRVKYYLYGGIYYRFFPSERAYVVVSAPF